MLDREGYRPNVGIVLVNQHDEVFWGKRIREHSWQFPQGGIKKGETPEQAMFRGIPTFHCAPRNIQNSTLGAGATIGCRWTP